LHQSSSYFVLQHIDLREPAFSPFNLYKQEPHIWRDYHLNYEHKKEETWQIVQW
jgi:hypothetical protein